MAGPSKGIRLSFLAQADQNKYEMLFSQVGGGTTVAKEVLSRSNIDDDNLAHIWDLSNVTNQPQLSFPEFATAMYLTSMKMTGSEIPATLPDDIRNEIRNAVIAVQNTPQQSVVSQQYTGYLPSQPANYLPPQPTGYSMQQPMMTGVIPMNGGPQVAMPTGMGSNNMDFTNRMMPHTANYIPPSGFESLSKNVKIPWAVTAEEKKRYSKIFKAWDTENKGTLSGDKAKEIFSQSGLPQNVLMQIWNLSDPNNQGKLNLDEFSVAMHLIYRKLNGYNVPETLPAELVPPSHRDLTDSVSQLKKSILDDIAKKRHLNNFRSTPSESPITTSRSISSPASRNTKKKEDEDNDTEVGYVSSARRMGPDRTRNRDLGSASASPTNSSYGYRGKQTRVFDLRKEIEEKKKLIQQLGDATHRVATPYCELSALDKKDIDGLKERIRELQHEISKTGSEQGQDAWSTYIAKTAELASLADQEKSLEAEIQYMLDVTLKGLLAQVDETENDLRDKKIQIVKSKASSTTSSSSSAAEVPLNIVGTGPNGEVTESDRIKAKAKAMVAARMGKITGKSSSPSGINTKAEIDKINEERDEFKLYTDSIADSLKEFEQALNTIHMEMNMIGLDIKKQDQDQKKIEERARFEHGENVAKDLKQFISQMTYDAALAKAPDVDPDFESRFPSF
ncbi:hypothetical protein [Parasitella parasitica]|uniref:Actin cytoskeleton-regulatory complex protein PAN1 n=1 Tax=Parasitella parasitica TaxID=35722 RepID=A0A0B7NNI6_9FUNG|nr:hypothetical protein [Parasitella parasitica]